ncbi:MAG TPA: hypothetical protein VFH60_10850 [Chloroflexia bacterium]|nr:hypothetical protein [Chloroflexia bacterium]
MSNLGRASAQNGSLIRRLWCRTVALPVCLMLLSVIAAPATTLAAKRGPSLLTISTIEVTPLSGGPGAVVEIRGVEIYTKVDLYLAVRKTLAARPGQPFPDPNGPTALLGTAEGKGPNGSFATRVTLPATWPSGKAIVEEDMLIGAVRGDVWLDYRDFTFTPPGLPLTGSEGRLDWLSLALLAAGFIAAGAWTLRRADAHRE